MRLQPGAAGARGAWCGWRLSRSGAGCLACQLAAHKAQQRQCCHLQPCLLHTCQCGLSPLLCAVEGVQGTVRHDAGLGWVGLPWWGCAGSPGLPGYSGKSGRRRDAPGGTLLPPGGVRGRLARGRTGPPVLWGKPGIAGSMSTMCRGTPTCALTCDWLHIPAAGSRAGIDRKVQEWRTIGAASNGVQGHVP